MPTLDLNKTVLNVSVNDDVPFCRISRNEVGKIVSDYSVEIELLKVLERRFNFVSNLVWANLEWGMLEPNTGNWSGVIGQVLNGTSNFGMCELSYTEERYSVVDFTKYTFISQITFISQSPGRIMNNWISQSLGNSIWLLNLTSFLFTLLSIYAIQIVLQKTVYEKVKMQKISLSFITWKLLAIYFRQQINLKTMLKCPLQIRLIYSFWLISAFLLSSFLCYSFYSILAVPKFASPIDTVEDLLAAIGDDSHFIITKDQSSMLNSYLYSKPENPIHYAIGQHINRTKQLMFGNMPELIPRVESSSSVIAIASRTNIIIRQQLYASKPLHIGSGFTDQDYLALVLPKKSPLMRPFNEMIVRVREMGLFDKWLVETTRKLSILGSDCKRYITYSRPNDIRRLTLTDILIIFIIWTVGIGMAILCYLGEIFFYCIDRKYDL